MAVAVQVPGLATIKVGTGAESALETLGYTRDGANIRPKAYYQDVPGDENGGDQGPPIDVQILGETATVRLELTKFDETVAAKVRARCASGTEGTPSTAGTLMFGDSKTIRVLVHTVTLPMNFTRCFLRNDIELNKGTKYTTLVLEFEAHKDGSGVLYNSTTA